MDEFDQLQTTMNLLIQRFTRDYSPLDADLAASLVEAAEQDLIASRLLHNNGVYNLAVYHLQQSVEKLVKAYSYMLGLLDKTSIRKTLHNPLDIFNLMMEQSLINQFVEKLSCMSGIDLTSGTTRTKAAVKDRVRIARLDKEIISDLVKFVDQTIELFAPFVVQMQSLVDEKGSPDSHLSLASAPLRLLMLSIVTSPHEAFTRYPDAQVKPSEYTKSLGIVSSMPDLWLQCEEALNGVQFFVKVAA